MFSRAYFVDWLAQLHQAHSRSLLGPYLHTLLLPPPPSLANPLACSLSLIVMCALATCLLSLVGHGYSTKHLSCLAHVIHSAGGLAVGRGLRTC